MKFTVIRYHSPSISFPTRWQAFEFAMNCGDFSAVIREIPGQAPTSEV